MSDLSAHASAPAARKQRRRYREEAPEERHETPAVARAQLVLRLFLLPLVLLAALAVVTVRPVPDPDVWFHMAFGRELVENGHFARTEMFSFTAAGREWISSGWAASVLLYLSHKNWGVPGLVWLTFSVAAAAHLLVYYAGVLRYRNSGGIALLQMAGILAAYLRYTPRPDVWSHLFLAGMLSLLLLADGRDKSQGKEPADDRMPKAGWLWGLPVLFALWPNFHAGFVAGLLAVAFYGLWRVNLWRRFPTRENLMALLPLALCGVAWMANPYGPRILALAGKIESIPHVQEKIYEWKPMWAGGPIQLPWPAYIGFALLVLLPAIIALKNLVPAFRGGSSWWRHVLILFFIGLALWQRRHVGLAAIALPVLILPDLERIRVRRAASVARRSQIRTRFTVPAAAVLGLATLIGLQLSGSMGIGKTLLKAPLHGSILPVFATQWLQANPPPGNIYNVYGAGGYLLYHLPPPTKVFIDGRLDCYDHKTWLDYLGIEDGSLPLEEGVRRYGLNTFVLYSRDALRDPDHLAFRLSESPDWQLVYFDDSYSAFVRKSPDAQEYLSSRGIQYANPFVPHKFRQALRNSATREQALAELNRMQTIPGQGGAWTGALAAAAAREMGDQRAADNLLAAALTRDPENPLARALRQER